MTGPHLEEQIEILGDFKPQLEEARERAQNWLDDEMADFTWSSKRYLHPHV